jgi:phospholipid/cholesterol/gamma-HCH transport system substrate-binding protein
MSMRVHPAAIGAFVVGAVALLLVALLVWGGTDLFRTKLNYVLFFDTDVTGLNKGAPVLGRGVKMGEVTDIQIQWGTPLVAVYITLEPQAVKGTAEAGPRRATERLVREEGLRAQLRMQSFVTGVLYVALDFHPHTPIVLRGRDEKVPELPTVPTDIEVWTAKLQRFAEKIDKVPLDQIGQTTAVILEEVKKIVESKATHDLLPNANAAIGDARTSAESTPTLTRSSPSSRVHSAASTPVWTRPGSWPSTWTAVSTRWPTRPRPRSRWPRRRSPTPDRSSRTCVASRPSSMRRLIRH